MQHKPLMYLRKYPFKAFYLLLFYLLLLPCRGYSQTVIFSEGFEEAGNDVYTSSQGVIPRLTNSWAYEKTNEGRLRMAAGNGYYRNGSRAATLDDIQNWSYTSVNYLVASIDLGEYVNSTQLLLSFSYMDHGDENSTNDRVWVKRENSAEWIEVYNLAPENSNNGDWNNVIDLNIGSALASQTPTSSIIQIRFGQEDNFPSTMTTANDGITFDDITLTGTETGSYIWYEAFSGYANGTTTGTGIPSIATWTADGVAGWGGVDVQNNQLRGINTTSSGRTTWSINSGDPIEINDYTDISISVDLLENGTFENGDYIQVQYSTDGGVWTDFDNNGYINTDFGSVTALQEGLNGNSLRLRIILSNNWWDEVYYVNNIAVSGTPKVVVGGNTYYSYQSGNWNEVGTWTHNPGGTTHTATDIPNADDNVVILSGRTVTLSDDVDTTGLKVTIREGGILDQSIYSFTAGLRSLEGTGTHRLASVNYPSVTSNYFVNAGGGTTEYVNTASFDLPAGQSIYNNLRLNAPGVVATQLSDISLNGDLHVKQGTYRINDNSAARRKLTIEKDVTVDAGAFLTIGTGRTTTTINPDNITGGTAPFINYYDAQSHRVVINGDFTNNGTVNFTTQTYPVYNALPVSGIATVYFRGTSNNTLTCNGETDFYNLVLDKGIDQSYSLTIYSSAYSNFRLFGANSAGGDGGGDNPNLKKALWIRTGTLILNGLTVIPSLTEGAGTENNPGSDYCIPSNGALQLDGSEVVILSTADSYREVNAAYGLTGGSNVTYGISNGTNNESLLLYGKIQLDNGYLSTRESGGIITSAATSGQFILNGGTFDAKQIKGLGGASYTQAGGTAIFRGLFQRNTSSVLSVPDIRNATMNTSRFSGGVDNGRATFSLESADNVFDVSGGTIQIYDPCGVSGRIFDVLASEGNINVTGGTIEIIPTAGSGIADVATHYIRSTAPLYNLNINRAGGSTVVELSAYPLIVKNNLAITSGDFSANDLDVSVGGDFYAETGISYLPGANWTIFNGSGEQEFNINTTATFELKKLKVDKTSGTTLTLAGTQSTVTVEDSLMILSATLDDGGKTIDFVNSATTAVSYLYNSGVHAGTGKILLSDDDPQLITGDGSGLFQNLEINNTDASVAPVYLGSNITINGTLTFSQDKLFDIGTHNLNFGPDATVVNADVNRFIRTEGNAGDGGVTKEYSATSTGFTFPVGAPSDGHANAEYTPATLTFGTQPTVYGSITVVPVGYEHPATTNKNRSLTYFWRIKSKGFTLGAGTVNHSYTYSTNDVVTGADIAEVGYVSAVYNNTAYTWTKGTAADVNESMNTIGGTGTNFEALGYIDGEFTAGDDVPTDPFGTPTVYYSYGGGGTWGNTSTWSLTDHHTPNPPPTPPGSSDIVIIGDQDSVYLQSHITSINTDVRSCASLKIEEGSALDIGYNPACDFGIVLSHENGNGNFRLTTSYRTGTIFSFPSGDFSDFNVNLGTTELYSTNSEANTVYWLPNGITSYGNLIISPLGGSNIIFPNNDVLIYGNLITRGQNSLSWFCPTWHLNYPEAPVQIVDKTITVLGNLQLEGGALIWIENENRAQDFIIYGDLIVSENAGLRDYRNAYNQRVSIGGSLINNSLAPAGGDNAYRGCNFTDVPLTFFGSGTEYVTNDDPSADTYTVIESLTLNKGTSQSDSLIVNITGTFNTPGNDWLSLVNGTFKYEHDANLNITTTSSFNIPSTAGLYVKAPGRNIFIADAGVNNNDVYLDGKLTIIDGDVYIGDPSSPNNNNDIEYSGGGSSEIDVRGGSLTVNGQIRRNPSITDGVLKYTQTGGDVTINGRNSISSNAKLEILNTGSEFNMDSGTLTIVRGSGGGTYGDLYLRPENSVVTGGEIIFATGTSGNQSYFLDANIPLNHLTVNGSNGNTAEVTILLSPLELRGDLTLETTTSILDANANYDIDVTIGGNFDNSGVYSHYNNLTIFDGGAQSVMGNSTISFYDLNVNPVTSLTLEKDITVQNNLVLSGGTLICGDNTLFAKADVENNATYTDNNTGLVLNGNSLQYIGGTGTWGQLELKNSSGARLSNDVILQSNLVMTTGILDINRYLLTLGVNSNINGSSFGPEKMIISDGVFSDVGIRKYLSIYSGAPRIFTFPLGVFGKYTPAKLTYTDNTNVGYVRINNINDNHPGVLDADNVLDYFWEVESNAIAGFNGSLKLNYDDGDVQVTGSNTEADYIAAGLLIPGTSWTKATSGALTDNVDEAGDTITFNFSGSNSLSGEYTAGIDAALPDQVPEFTSINSDDWSNPANWQQTAGDPYTLTGAPNGFIIIIDSDDTVTADINYALAYRTEINGKLKISSTTYGHNLGTVSGSGVISIDNGTLPAGRYTSFFDCSNSSTIQYGGNTDYSIIADLYTDIPKLHFIGSGSRILPNKDLTVCQQLLIDGPTLDNSVNNKKLTIQGTMERYNSGTFISGTGTGAIVCFSGTAAQSIGGTLGDFTGVNAFHNFEIDNSSGITINTGGAMEVKGGLFLTNGIIASSTTNTITITNTDVNCVTPNGGSTTSFVNGPLTKKINQGDDFSFPIGKGRVPGNKINLSSIQTGTQFWTVEYFNTNATSENMANPLTYVNNDDYWTVSSGPGNQAYVNLDWDASSDLTPLMTQNGISDMRVAGYNETTSEWEELSSTASGNNNNGTVSTTSRISVPATGSADYTTACINIVKPRARFNPSGAVCGTAGIPVTFTYSGAIPLNYTLNYTIDGVAQTQVIVTSVPYTLPTPTAGEYQLTGFTYNSGANTGVVDPTKVDVYEVPTTADAGKDQSLCGATNATLAANTPVVGTGLWTIINGTGGTVVSPTLPNSEFNGTNGTTYTLRWTVTNGGCESSDEIGIAFPLLPVQPEDFTNASTDVCRGQTGIVYTVPNDPTISNYSWSYAGTGETINGTGNSVTLDFNASATSGTLSVDAENGCGTSSARTINITVHPVPSITINDGSLYVCQGGTSVNLTFSGTTGSPDRYNIDFDVVAESEGFTDVTNANLPASPVSIIVPGAVDVGTYNAVLTVHNALGGCISVDYPITITVSAIPKPTIAGNDTTCNGTTLTYTTEAGMSNYSWTVNPLYGTVISGTGTNSITVDWHNYTALGAPTEISVNYDNAGCIPVSAGTMGIMVFKIPSTGALYHLKNNWSK